VEGGREGGRERSSIREEKRASIFLQQILIRLERTVALSLLLWLWPPSRLRCWVRRRVRICISSIPPSSSSSPPSPPVMEGLLFPSSMSRLACLCDRSGEGWKQVGTSITPSSSSSPSLWFLLEEIDRVRAASFSPSPSCPSLAAANGGGGSCGGGMNVPSCMFCSAGGAGGASMTTLLFWSVFCERRGLLPRLFGMGRCLGGSQVGCRCKRSRWREGRRSQVDCRCRRRGVEVFFGPDGDDLSTLPTGV